MPYNITAFDSLKNKTHTFTEVPGNRDAVAIDLVKRCIVLETGTPSIHIEIKKVEEVQ